MSNKTRKHIWPVSLVVSIAIIGALAAFLVLANNPGTTMAHGGDIDHDAACAAMTDQERRDHNASALLEEGEAVCGATSSDDGPAPVTGNGDSMDDEFMHATMPLDFWLEGLDNGARLNWEAPAEVKLSMPWSWATRLSGTPGTS